MINDIIKAILPIQRIKDFIGYLLLIVKSPISATQELYITKKPKENYRFLITSTLFSVLLFSITFSYLGDFNRIYKIIVFLIFTIPYVVGLRLMYFFFSKEAALTRSKVEFNSFASIVLGVNILITISVQCLTYSLAFMIFTENEILFALLFLFSGSIFIIPFLAYYMVINMKRFWAVSKYQSLKNVIISGFIASMLSSVLVNGSFFIFRDQLNEKIENYVEQYMIPTHCKEAINFKLIDTKVYFSESKNMSIILPVNWNVSLDTLIYYPNNLSEEIIHFEELTILGFLNISRIQISSNNLPLEDYMLSSIESCQEKIYSISDEVNFTYPTNANHLSNMKGLVSSFNYKLFGDIQKGEILILDYGTSYVSFIIESEEYCYNYTKSVRDNVISQSKFYE